MTVVLGALASERWLDEVLIIANFTNIDGDFVLHVQPPAGLGDLAIMEVAIYAGPLATSLASPETKGGFVKVLNPAGSANVDILGVFRWTVGVPVTGYIAAYISPDPLVLWREGELLALEGQEMDTNATPTVDPAVFVKCVRVRPRITDTEPLTIQLVRPRSAPYQPG